MSDYRELITKFWNDPENNNQTYPKGTREYREGTDRKDVKGKPRTTYKQGIARPEYLAVSDIGLAKYGNRDTWKYSTNGVDTYTQAAARHCLQAMIGHKEDPEDGIPHLWKVWWNLMAVIWHNEQKENN